jgi:hypothetical protein
LFLFKFFSDFTDGLPSLTFFSTWASQLIAAMDGFSGHFSTGYRATIFTELTLKMLF